MKKKFIVIGAALAGGLLLLTVAIPLCLLPEEFSVTRSAKIDAPPGRVFDLVNDLRTLTEWSPWKAMDPTMELAFSEQRAGEGAWYRWSSENSGQGRMTITASERPRLVEAALEFEGGKPGATTRFIFEPDDGGTRVRWQIQGDDGGRLVHRYFAALMDAMVGPQCADGLARLKKLAESS